jgi:hypothetical protein
VKKLLEFLALRKARSLQFIKNPEGEAMNSYLTKQFRRLRSRSGNPIQFWNLARLLLRSSNSLRLLALSNVSPHWYKERTEASVLRALRDLDAICSQEQTTYTVNEVLIPKANGDMRTISVPPFA